MSGTGREHAAASASEAAWTLVERTLNALLACRRELPRESCGLPLTWHVPCAPPAASGEGEPAAEWRAFDPANAAHLTADAPNWFRADLTFPEEVAGFRIAGDTAYLHIRHGLPFTLWIDGEQAYREDRPWHSSGPIADPLARPIEPGRTLRLTVRLEPTAQLPVAGPPQIDVVPRCCRLAADDLEAAEYELRFAWALAQNAAERDRVARAAACLDLEALAARRWQAFEATAARMDRELEGFRERARAHTVHILAYGHLDIDWQWTWDDTLMCIRRDVHSALRLMEECPDLRMTMSQAPFYKAIAEHDPASYRALTAHILAGRWENTAATWVENDFNMAAGEALVRQLQLAREWGLAELGAPATILWAPDTFGFPGNLPQLCRLARLPALFQSRCAPGGEAPWPARIWEGDDGSEVLALAGGYAGGLGAGILAYLLRGVPFGVRTGFTVFGCGDHGGGYARLALESLERCRHRPVMPVFRFGSPAQLRDALLAERDRLPRTRGFSFNLFEGGFTTHAAAKRDNRRGEQALLEAETLAAMAGLDVADRLRPAWERVFYNQFHDILCGAAVRESYTAAAERATEAQDTAEAATRDAVRALTAGTPGPGAAAVGVLNALGWPRTEAVCWPEAPAATRSMIGPAGEATPVQHGPEGACFVARDVPAFGRAVFAPSAADAPGGDVVVRDSETHFTVETPLYSATIHRASGVVCAYAARPGGSELVAYGLPKPRSHVPVTRLDLALNVFQILDESPNSMAAWLIHDVVREESLLAGADTRLVATGPVFARFRIERAFRASRLIEELTFYRDLPGIHCHAWIDWRECGSAAAGVPHLKVAFTVAGEISRLLLEGPYTLRHTPPNGQQEVTQNFMALSGPSGGFALLNDGSYGCDALGSRARISLVRGSYTPDPESDRGLHDARFAFVPFAPGTPDAWCVRAGAAFNRPLRVVAGGGTPRADANAVTIEGAGSVVCSAVQRTASGLCLRFFETAGAACTARVRLGAQQRSAEEVDFTGATLGPCELADGALRLAFRPYEIKTVRIEGCRPGDWMR